MNRGHWMVLVSAVVVMTGAGCNSDGVQATCQRQVTCFGSANVSETRCEDVGNACISNMQAASGCDTITSDVEAIFQCQGTLGCPNLSTALADFTAALADSKDGGVSDGGQSCASEFGTLGGDLSLSNLHCLGACAQGFASDGGS